MLALLSELAHGDRALGVDGIPSPTGDRRRARRCDVVCFVNHQDVERVPAAGLRIARLRVHVAQQSLRTHLGQRRHAHDGPREDLERVGLKAMRTADLGHQLRVHDRELQAELLPHHVLPLQ